MAFDKAKVLRAAEKYLAQGKITAAIKEYRDLIEHDPADLNTLNILGDLYVRTNQKEQAVDCFKHIAEHYREQGFGNKAIAMYKKVDRLTPGSPEIAEQLAMLFESEGLTVNARSQYMFLADAYTKAGEAQRALEVWRKVADLDPQNVEIRLRLAEGFLREGLKEDAARAFSQAGQQLHERGDFERSLYAYGQTLELIPNDYEALSGMAATHLSRGTGDEAAEILERAVAAAPEDVKLLELLAHAYVEAEDAPAAERATSALVSQQPAAYARFVDVSRLYIKEGDIQAAVRVIESVIGQLLSGRDEELVLTILGEVLARDPEHVDALRLLVRVYWWQRDAEKLHSALERLAEAAQAAHRVEDERSALTQLARLEPGQMRYLERLEELGGAHEEAADESIFASQPVEEEVPSFESFMPEVQTVSPDFSEPQPAAADLQFEWNAVTESEPPAAQADTTAIAQYETADPSSSFADLNDWTDEASARDEVKEIAPVAPVTYAEDPTPFIESAPAAQTEEQEEEVDSRREQMWRQELESVDFYIAQGYTDIALDTLDMLERQFGQHAEIEERREKLRDGSESAPSVQHEETIEFSAITPYEFPTQNDDESKAIAPFEMAEGEEAPFVVNEPKPVQGNGSHPSRSAVQHGIDPGLAAVFDEFRTAVEDEDPAIADGDYETHYNLGLAYKEMDLMDEAIEELQSAAALVSQRDGTPRYLQCCNLLGHCFMQKNMPQVAAMWFQKGLDTPGHTEEEYQALRFELGTAYEKMGDLERAIKTFTEVYGINVTYRGVAGKLRELQGRK